MLSCECYEFLLRFRPFRSEFHESLLGFANFLFERRAGNQHRPDAQFRVDDVRVEYHEVQFFQFVDDEEVLDRLPEVFLRDSSVERVPDERLGFRSLDFDGLPAFPVFG